MKVVVRYNVKGIGINSPCACIIEGVQVKESDNELMGFVNHNIEYIKSNQESILKGDYYTGFQNLFENLGYSQQKTAADRLIDYYVQRPFKTINNIVDSYNIISAQYGYPIGLHDFDLIRGNVVIERTLGGLDIIPMLRKTPKKVRALDLIYRDEENVMCWMGKKDVDSDLHKVDSRTTSVFVMCIGNALMDYDRNKFICSQIYDTIKLTCPEAKISFCPIEIG